MKNEVQMESPKSAEMDPEIEKLFEKDHQTNFEKEVLSILECKEASQEPIGVRWCQLQNSLQERFNHHYGHVPEIVPYLKQCAGELFARVYFREFIANPKNTKHKEQGSKAILTRMRTELQGLKLWSCVFRGLEWRICDKFGDPDEEESTPVETRSVDMERIGTTFKNFNLSWALPGTTSHWEESRGIGVPGSYSTAGAVHKPPLPNISHSLPILSRPSDCNTPTAAAHSEAVKKTPIRLKIRIPHRQPSAPIPDDRSRSELESSCVATEALSLIQPTIIPTPGTNVNGLENLPYFLRFLNLRCDRSDKLWRTLCTDLYADYALWARKVNAPAMGKIQIGIELRNYNIYSRVFNGKRYYVGVRLKYLIRWERRKLDSESNFPTCQLTTT